MRTNFTKCYVLSLLLFGQEILAFIDHEGKKKSKATEIWILGRVTKFSRTEMKINSE